MQRPDSPAPKTADPATALNARMPVYAALWLVLLGLGGVFAPSGAFPMNSLRIAVVLWLGVTAGLAAGFWRRETRTRVLTALGHPVAMLGMALTVWTLARWNFNLVPYLGRDLVNAQLWFGIGLAGTALAPAMLATAEARNGAGQWAARLLSLAALLAALHGLNQYFVVYPGALQDLLAEQGGRPVTDLMTQSQIHILRERRVGSTFADPNIYAGMLSALLVFCVAGLRRGEAYAWRLAAATGLVLTLWALLLTRSRGGWLSALTALVATGILVWRTPPRGARLAAALALAAVAGQALADGGLLERIGNISTIRERVFYWAIALKVWLHNPLFGDGPGSFAMYYPMLKSPMARESQYAHSWVFQTLAETGLVGLGLAAAMWTLIVWQVLRGSGPGRWFALAAAVMAFNGLVQFTLQQREMALLTGALIGAMVGLDSGGASGDDKQDNGGNRTAVLARYARRGGWSAAMITLVLVCGGYMSLRTQMAKHWGWEGRDALAAGELDAAKDSFLRAKAWQPGDMTTEMALAEVELRRESISMAWPHLETAVKLNPYSSSVRAAQAEFFMRRGDAVAALERLDEAIRLYPSRVAYRLTRAQWRLERGEPEKARADLGYIGENGVQVWEYEQPRYERLRAMSGLPPAAGSAR